MSSRWQSLRQGSELPWRHEQGVGLRRPGCGNVCVQLDGPDHAHRDRRPGHFGEPARGQEDSMEVDANPRHGAGQRDNREQQQRVADRLRPSSDRLSAGHHRRAFVGHCDLVHERREQRSLPDPEALERHDPRQRGTAGQQTDKSSIVVDEFLSLRSLPCAYKAAGTGAIGDIEQGALYLITVGDNAAGNTDSDAILAFRTRFLDV